MRSGSARRVLGLILLSVTVQAQSPELSKTVQEFVRVRGPKIVLTHVRVIDGTGGPPVEDQNVVIEAGKIAGVEKGSDGVRFAGAVELGAGQIRTVLRRGWEYYSAG